MNPKKQILEFIRKTLSNAPRSGAETNSDKPGEPAGERERIQEILDGMSTGTARIIVEREVGPQIKERYQLTGIENKGRYYVARIIRQDGHTLASLLIDKQNGNVELVG